MKRFPLGKVSIVLLSFGLILQIAAGQTPTSTTTPSSDPQAIVLAGQALVALGTGQISDVTLTGTLARSVGPDVETGTLTLKALGLAQSRMDLNTPTGTLTEIRTNANGTPTGALISNGVVHAVANHNCSTDAAWFFPALSVLSYYALNPSSVISYVGQETRAGRLVQHLHYFVQSPVGDPTGIAQHLTSEDIFLDNSTLLPVALAYNEHPDKNALVDIPVEIDFSDYRVVSGVKVPFRVQKTFNGSLLLDITVQSAVLNSGLTNADFTAQ